MEAKVAILLATYNGEKYIREQLRSLFAQTYKNFCIYVHDDSSKDATMDILQAFRENEPDRIKIIGGPKTGGAKENFFYLMRNVEAEYYFFCDQDDIWEADKLQKSMEELLHRRGPVLVCTDLSLMNAEGKKLQNSYVTYTGKNMYDMSVEAILRRNLFTGCTLGMNRKLRDIAIQCKHVERLRMHDWWVGLVAALKGHIIYIDDPLVRYRSHSGNATGNLTKKRWKKKLGRILRPWRGYRIKKEYMRSRIRVARELLPLLEERDEAFTFLSKYAKIETYSKKERIRFYEQYHLLEKDKSRFWQYLWV